MITFDGLDDVVRDLMTLSATMDNKKEDMLNKLADVAEENMQGFYSPSGDYDFNDSVVKRSVNRNTAKISAKGSKVTFIEYGAGDYTTNPQSMGFEGASYSPGDWSKTHQKEYSRFGSWHHKKKRYTFQPSERYAYGAYKEIMETIPKISKGFSEI